MTTPRHTPRRSSASALAFSVEPEQATIWLSQDETHQVTLDPAAAEPICWRATYFISLWGGDHVDHARCVSAVAFCSPMSDANRLNTRVVFREDETICVF